MTEGQDKNNTLSSKLWLDAHTDALAGLYVFGQGMELVDLQADGDYKLVFADLGTNAAEGAGKLKVYKGVALSSEHTLLDLPSSLVAFYMDSNVPRIPALAVSSSSSVFIYKNLRPYFKFSLPSMNINDVERDLWSQAASERINAASLRDALESLQSEIGTKGMTTRSQRYLMLEGFQEMKTFLKAHAFPENELKRQSVVTCMTTLKKSRDEPGALTCLIVATESGHLYILDPEAFTALTSAQMDGVPSHLVATGLYDVEYRVLIGCRDGQIFQARRGDLMAKLLVALPSAPIAVHLFPRIFVAPCMDNSVRCYSLQGVYVWHDNLPASPLASELIHIEAKGLLLVAIALENSQIRIYSNHTLVDGFQTPEPVVALKFGRYGREDNTLALVTRGGSLLIKILRRTANFKTRDIPDSSTEMTTKGKLNVPKRTKLFVDQTLREREHYVAMHRSFQRDLFRLRLATARAFVQSMETGATPVSTDSSLPLKVGAQVIGLGPTFRVRVELSNTSSNIPLMDLAVTFNFDDKLYQIQQKYMKADFLIPGTSLFLETAVHFISDLGLADDLQVLVLHNDDPIPKLTALIKMPVAEIV
ncbi:unnamed protein product [Cyprideis torosa]|uniref:Bardet-Biedl syndrome 1 n=1 Tax=Cyprideis torosa TaxID=163714 RepID=A0A7R8W1I7_9CRUS|nr:unnamed protein product [Cyprideis torosa]CAG0880955.1 unnamed protein product [Cyprideis torosa]